MHQNFSKYNLDDFIEEVAKITENKEHYQRSLALMAIEITKTYGDTALKVLSEEIKERHGKTISYNTLQNYKWVEEKTGHFDFPDDISFFVRQAIAGTDDPQIWADKVKEGLSGMEIYRLIKEGRYNKTTCPVCGRITYNRKNKK